MKPAPRLLLLTAIMLWTLACLGTQETIPLPTGDDASPSVTIPTEAIAVTATATNMPSPYPGLTIAYILDGNVWFWDSTGAARQLTKDGDATRVRISDD